MHVVESGLTLLSQANLPLKFSDHAFITTTYLINKLLSPTLGNTSPFLLLYFKFPDYKFLKAFGCSCFPHLRPYNSNKLVVHSKECIFLGYTLTHKGYKCPDSNGKTFISKDVMYNECRFPYSTMFLASKSEHVSAQLGMSHGLPLPISSIFLDPPTQVIVSPVPVTPLPSSSPTTSSKVSSQILKITSNNLVSLKQT